MAGPYLIPQIGTFRVLTNTVGVDFYELTYAKYCMEEGAADTVAKTIDDLNVAGYTAVSNDALFPNAPLLRVAEGGDAIANAVRSFGETSARAAAGRILCTICEVLRCRLERSHTRTARPPRLSRAPQLGGLVYTFFIVAIAIVLLGFLPLFNFFAQLCFDGTVAVVTAGQVKPNTRNKQSAITNALLKGANSASRNAITRQGFVKGVKGLAKNSLVAKNARLLYKGGKGAYRAAKAAPGAYRAAKAKAGEAREAARRGVKAVRDAPGNLKRAAEDKYENLREGALDRVASARDGYERTKARTLDAAQDAKAGAKRRAKALKTQIAEDTPFSKARGRKLKRQREKKKARREERRKEKTDRRQIKREAKEEAAEERVEKRNERREEKAERRRERREAAAQRRNRPEKKKDEKDEEAAEAAETRDEEAPAEPRPRRQRRGAVDLSGRYDGGDSDLDLEMLSPQQQRAYARSIQKQDGVSTGGAVSGALATIGSVVSTIASIGIKTDETTPLSTSPEDSYSYGSESSSDLSSDESDESDESDDSSSSEDTSDSYTDDSEGPSCSTDASERPPNYDELVSLFGKTPSLPLPRRG